MQYISHMYQVVHVHMRQLFQYTYLIWIRCNQHCDQEHWYTYISHYWHLNKYVSHITDVCPTTLLLWPIYRPRITAHTSSKMKQSTAANSHMIANYVPKTNVPLKCHIYATYANKFMCRYETITSTQCNHQCYQNHCYTYIFHYWHMPLKNKPATLCMYVPLHSYCSLHTDPTLLHTSIRNH